MKKVKQKIDVKVPSGQQRYWINKEHKKPGEKVYATKGDKVLVQRRRREYGYTKEVEKIQLTRTELRRQFDLKTTRSKIQDLKKNSSKVVDEPFIVSKDVVDFSKKDYKGVDTIDKEKLATLRKEKQKKNKKLNKQLKKYQKKAKNKKTDVKNIDTAKKQKTDKKVKEKKKKEKTETKAKEKNKIKIKQEYDFRPDYDLSKEKLEEQLDEIWLDIEDNKHEMNDEELLELYIAYADKARANKIKSVDYYHTDKEKHEKAEIIAEGYSNILDEIEEELEERRVVEGAELGTIYRKYGQLMKKEQYEKNKQKLLEKIQRRKRGLTKEEQTKIKELKEKELKLEQIGKELPKPYHDYGRINYPGNVQQFEEKKKWLKNNKEKIRQLTGLTNEDFEKLDKGGRQDQIYAYDYIRRKVWNNYYKTIEKREELE